MKWLAGGLAFVSASTVSALLLGIALHGLGRGFAIAAFVFGLVVAALGYIQTEEAAVVTAGDDDSSTAPAAARHRRVWFWLLAACFAFFAFRSFCWLIYLDGNQWKIQSVNNLGDLGLHITYIENFASGVPLWPDNPIHVGSKLRYPAGTDLFNALLLLLRIDLVHGLVWAGLIGSFATFYALYRWGGPFGIAGFLFNGGVAGMQIVQTWHWIDYQGASYVAWKSLPLAMLVTQRGLLYALPAGLLLLYHWRAKYFPGGGATFQGPDSTPRKLETCATAPLPFWIELTLYASMPLFHVHTFMALSIVAAFFFAIGDGAMRRQLGTLVAMAFLPATFFIWTITDQFHAGSILRWKLGWVQTSGEMAMPFFLFWFFNFGVLVPLAILLVGFCVSRASQPGERFSFKAHPALAFLAPAALVFLFACVVKTAPWEWDNLKLIIWAYLIILPFLWSELIAHWPTPIRAGVCVALFASGFISLFGGLVSKPDGYGFADRAELDAVGAALRKLPADARFAAYPTYNHPLLLQGRRMVLGYPGHLWTQGFDYARVEKQLNALMGGAADWREQARALRVRYLFWGREETKNYPASARPWEDEAQLVATGEWGSIYDLQPPVADQSQ